MEDLTSPELAGECLEDITMFFPLHAKALGAQLT